MDICREGTGSLSIPHQLIQQIEVAWSRLEDLGLRSLQPGLDVRDSLSSCEGVDQHAAARHETKVAEENGPRQTDELPLVAALY